MTESRSALFLSLHTYVFLLVIPAEAVLFCRADKNHISRFCFRLCEAEQRRWAERSDSRSGRWPRPSCAPGYRPCWGCWRCPAEGWRAALRGYPGCWAYGAGLRRLPSGCCRWWRSGSSSGEPFLEGRSDPLQENHRGATMTQRRGLFSRRRLRREEGRVTPAHHHVQTIQPEVVFTSNKHCILHRVCVFYSCELWLHHVTGAFDPLFVLLHSRGLTLLAVASLFVTGGDAPLDFDVGGRLAVELAVGSRFGQRQVAAGGRLAGLQLGNKSKTRASHGRQRECWGGQRCGANAKPRTPSCPAAGRWL